MPHATTAALPVPPNTRGDIKYVTINRLACLREQRRGVTSDKVKTLSKLPDSGQRPVPIITSCMRVPYGCSRKPSPSSPLQRQRRQAKNNNWPTICIFPARLHSNSMGGRSSLRGRRREREQLMLLYTRENNVPTTISTKAHTHEHNQYELPCCCLPSSSSYCRSFTTAGLLDKTLPATYWYAINYDTQ